MAVLKYYTEHEYYLGRGTPHSAGLDLASPITLTLFPDAVEYLDLDLHVAIPEGYVGLVVPRSSLGKRGMRLSNTVGVIDSDYRGSIKLMIENTSGVSWTIQAWDRIAQLIVVPFFAPKPQKVQTLDHLGSTERGDGGFGSTGR